jgi:hypothetical protein
MEDNKDLKATAYGCSFFIEMWNFCEIKRRAVDNKMFEEI